MRNCVDDSSGDCKYYWILFMMLYCCLTQDIQVVNFSNISRGFVNVIIMYKGVEGRSVKLEAMGNIDKDYVQTLDFLWQAMKRAAQEAPSDYSGPFSPLTLPYL